MGVVMRGWRGTWALNVGDVRLRITQAAPRAELEIGYIAYLVVGQRVDLRHLDGVVVGRTGKGAGPASSRRKGGEASKQA